MLAYTVRRLLWGVVLMLAVLFVTYIVFFIIPTPQFRFVRRTEGSPVSVRQAIGVHGPVLEEYAQFVWKLAHGHFGHSYRGRRNVGDVIAAATPVTASLVIGGTLTWLLIAFPIGILSALRPRSLLDRTVMVAVLVAISVHPLWLGLILSYFLGFRLHLFPLGGYCDAFNPPPGADCGGPVQWAYHLLLPWFTFAALHAALYVRMIRAAVLETLDEDYVRTAWAKGASRSQTLRSHVLRNALLPVVTMLGMDMGIAFGGTLFVESVFGLQGLGRTMVQAVEIGDLPMILGVIVVVTAAIVVFNIAVDLLYALIDPRVRVLRSMEAEEVPRAGRRKAPAPVAEGVSAPS